MRVIKVAKSGEAPASLSARENETFRGPFKRRENRYSAGRSADLVGFKRPEGAPGHRYTRASRSGGRGYAPGDLKGRRPPRQSLTARGARVTCERFRGFSRAIVVDATSK